MHVDFKYFAKKKKKTNLALILVPTMFDSILRFALQKRTDRYTLKRRSFSNEGERERERETKREREKEREKLVVCETRKVTF